MALIKAITMSFRLVDLEISLAAMDKGQYELRILRRPNDEYTTTLDEKEATVLGEGILDFVSMTSEKR
jgi:hypothetical protein